MFSLFKRLVQRKEKNSKRIFGILIYKSIELISYYKLGILDSHSQAYGLLFALPFALLCFVMRMLDAGCWMVVNVNQYNVEWMNDSMKKTQMMRMNNEQ